MTAHDPAPPTSPGSDGRVTLWLYRGLILTIVGLLALTLYVTLKDQLQLETLAEQEAQLRRWSDEYPLTSLAIAAGLYIVVTALSLPVSMAMTLVAGWYFGFVRATVLASFSSTAGATLAFLLSRYLLGHALQRRFGDRLERFNEELHQNGAFYLLTLRLLPTVPFFMINLGMGLTQIRTRTFWWASQLGMLPGTMVVVYAGAQVPTLRELADEGLGAIFTPTQLLQLALAFTLLGTFPLAARKGVQWWYRHRSAS